MLNRIPKVFSMLNYDECQKIGIFNKTAHIKVIVRKDFKQCISSEIFWRAFPEYKPIKDKYLWNMTKKAGCCSKLNPELENELSQQVMKNPSKWKQYFNANKIQLFYGTPRRCEIL